MDKYELSKSLDNSWKREEILKRIQNGDNIEKIIDDFFKSNKEDLSKLGKLINKNNSQVLDNLITLSDCEAALIKKIKGLSIDEMNISKKELDSSFKKKKRFNINVFMHTWSNQFVIIALIAISLISLSKQAWA